jgi:L-arabinonolactonase
MDAEVIADCRNRLGESVIWDGTEVLWVNVHDGEIWRSDLQEPPRKQQLPDRVGAIGLRASGGLVAGLAGGFALVDPGAGTVQRLADVERELPTTRLNDGRVDRQGRFVCGGMDEAEDQRAISAVYRLDPDGSTERIVEGIGCANSICFSPDGTTMYFSDMPTGTILAYRYDVDTGRPHSPRVFTEFAGQPGLPDGSTIDADGCLWNAQWDGGRVVRYTPAGRIDRVIELPVSRPTCVCFGGDDLSTLFITTARFQLDQRRLASEPHAGGLFAIRPGVQGLPEPRFAG